MDVVADVSSGHRDVARCHDGGGAGQVLEFFDILVQLVAVLSNVVNVFANGDDLANVEEVGESADLESSSGVDFTSVNLSASDGSDLNESGCIDGSGIDSTADLWSWIAIAALHKAVLWVSELLIVAHVSIGTSWSRFWKTSEASGKMPSSTVSVPLTIPSVVVNSSWTCVKNAIILTTLSKRFSSLSGDSSNQSKDCEFHSCFI